jgi:dihydroflavonol-4-reductase
MFIEMIEKKVVILGVTGFIGSHVAEQFRKSGWRVRALVRSSCNRQALEAFADEVVLVNFSSEDSLTRALSGFDTVVNCIATVRLNTTVAELNKVQVGITEIVARAAVRAAIKHLLLLSTVEIYGFNPPFKKSEVSPYQPEFNFQQSFVDKEGAFRQDSLNSIVSLERRSSTSS